jgi:hypothetical protein
MSHYDHVMQLKAQVNELRSKLYDLEKELSRETKKLQRECSHLEYDVESDGDAHSSGHYYTCRTCGYFSRFRPSPTR